jgi:iron(III) transport system ATP-binding protein
MTSIRIEGLSKSFGEVRALDGIDLEIRPGEIFFLLGPSGCGKTTLLRHIAGFYQPDRGRIFFGEKDVTRLPPDRRNTGMMFQSYALWPHMTVAKNVAFGLEERRLPKAEIAERVKKVLETVRMSAYAERKINQLSGGQQQRVALARAMVIRPSCLLLDEPLSNLDAKLRHEMRDEIRELCREFGLTAVYVTHDQGEALSISDRMAILDTGRIAQVGSPLEVYRRPRTRLVADFIGRTNFIPGKLAGMEGGLALVGTPLGVLAGVFSDPEVRLAAGSPVTVSIRPEAFQLHGESTESPVRNAFKGVLGKSLYLGESAQHELICGEAVLKITEANPRATHAAENTGCVARVDPGDVVILAE